jgi:hypothetical protein
MYTLNIGLKPSEYTSRTDPITRAEVLAAVRGAGFRVLSYREANSATEPTAVVVVAKAYRTTADWGAFYDISVALSQDCIAALVHDTGCGALYGPNAAEWGQFDPVYFITADEAERQCEERLQAA